MSVSVVVGCQWGDEGKGKIVDILSENFDIIVRYQGGANAGHTVEVGDKKYILHLIPSGILRKDTICVLGNGVVIDPFAFLAEYKVLKEQGFDLNGRLFISANAHLILPYHKQLDKQSEAGDLKIGTTGRGIGPGYVDKYSRRGIRVADIFRGDIFGTKLYRAISERQAILRLTDDEVSTMVASIMADLEEFRTVVKDLVVHSSEYLNRSIAAGKRVLLEGAQGTLLDVDHGTYPFVTSSNPTSGGACTGSGIPPGKISEVTGIVKAYTTRVGEGPFPTELYDEEGEALRKAGNEYGATTGRPRRCGWFDIPLVRYSCMVNGVTGIALTKLDVLSLYDEIKVCTGYTVEGVECDYFPVDAEDMENVTPVYTTLPGWKTDISGISDRNLLPENAKKYLAYIEEEIKVPFTFISTGPRRDQTVIVK